MERSPTADAPARPAPRSCIQSQCLGLKMEPIRSNQQAGTPAFNWKE